MLLWQVASFTLWHLRPVLNMILRCQIVFRGRPNFHLQDAMSGSAPEKPVSSRPKKRNNDRPSVADFCRLCKCSFKTVYGNFPSKSTPSELSKDPQPKASYISTKNISNTSCRNGEERNSLKSICASNFRRTEYFRNTGNWWDPHGGSKPWSCLN